MPAARRDRGVGPYEAEVVRRVAERAPLGFAVFLLCLVLNTIFESLHFPERRVWMATFAAGFLLLVAVASALVRRRPAWSVYVLVAFVNLVGVALNVYHLLVGASVAMGLWSLTGLLTASAVILPWGSRSQALACVGTLLSYPLQLAAGTDPLTWGAGGTYLFLVGSLGVFAASLFARSLRSDLQLMAALSEREARLQSYFDLSLVGAAILSPDGRCGEVNDELCRMFGYSRPELLRLSWLDLVHAEECRTAAAALARALSPAGTPQALDMRCVRKDGETLDAIVSVRGLPGPEGPGAAARRSARRVAPRRPGLGRRAAPDGPGAGRPRRGGGGATGRGRQGSGARDRVTAARGSGAGRPGALAAGRLEPGFERGEVHAAGWAGPHRARARRRPRPAHRPRHRRGHQPGLPPVRLRAVPAGRQLRHPPARRPRARPRDRPRAGRASRGQRARRERRDGAGGGLHRRAAAARVRRGGSGARAARQAGDDGGAGRRARRAARWAPRAGGGRRPRLERGRECAPRFLRRRGPDGGLGARGARGRRSLAAGRRGERHRDAGRGRLYAPPPAPRSGRPARAGPRRRPHRLCGHERSPAGVRPRLPGARGEAVRPGPARGRRAEGGACGARAARLKPAGRRAAPR